MEFPFYYVLSVNSPFSDGVVLSLHNVLSLSICSSVISASRFFNHVILESSMGLPTGLIYCSQIRKALYTPIRFFINH